MKLIVGHLTAKPGQRDAFIAAARNHAEATRKEPGCYYFELVPLPDHPDRMLLAEAFASDEAHRLHEDTDLMRELWSVMPEMLTEVTLDNVVADAEHIRDRFADGRSAGRR
jgi:quinol monooxygenase YgiN